MVDNRLISGTQLAPATVLMLEILIDTETNQVTYNQLILPGKVTQTNTGITMVYDPVKGMNVQLPCNNKDLIKREEIADKQYIKYSIACSKSRVAEFKQELVKYVRATEDALLKDYNKLVTQKTALLAELDTYLSVEQEEEPHE